MRSLGQFVRFLKVAALQSGQLLNYSAVASDAGVPEATVRGYFEILRDTLIGVPLEPRRSIANHEVDFCLGVRWLSRLKARENILENLIVLLDFLFEISLRVGSEELLRILLSLISPKHRQAADPERPFKVELFA